MRSCRFDGTKPRWKKTPRPQSGSAVFAVGLAYGVHLAGGIIMVDVDQVQLNVGTTAASSSAPRAESGGSTHPSGKRRRFPTSTVALTSLLGSYHYVCVVRGCELASRLRASLLACVDAHVRVRDFRVLLECVVTSTGRDVHV